MIKGSGHIGNRDIQTDDDIADLVNSFYEKVRRAGYMAKLMQLTKILPF